MRLCSTSAPVCSTSAFLIAGGTFASVADITKIQLVVQYATLGVCGGRSFSGAPAAAVTVAKLAPLGGPYVPPTIAKAAAFSTSTPQCARYMEGEIYAAFSVANTGAGKLLLTATVDGTIECGSSPGEHGTH